MTTKALEFTTFLPTTWATSPVQNTVSTVLQVNLIVAGVSQKAGKHKRDLLHLAFFTITAFEGGLNDLSTQEKMREALPFLMTAV